MDKYIKESDLFKRLLNVDFKHDYDGCIKFCQSIPAADVQEVKRGRWEMLKNRSDYVECFSCGYRVMHGKASEWHYCPNCGALMVDENE